MERAVQNVLHWLECDPLARTEELETRLGELEEFVKPECGEKIYNEIVLDVIFCNHTHMEELISVER